MAKRNRTDRPPLKFHFHNPNSPEETVNLLIDVFLDVQKPRAEATIQEAINAASEPEKEEKPPPETG